MLALAGSVVLGAVLLGAAVAKLARPRRSEAALGTYGFAAGPTRWVAWGGLIGIEIGLAVGVLAGVDLAAYAAAALMALLAATLVSALLRGRAGAPCACFGPGSTVTWVGVVRNLLLAAGFAVLPSLPERSLPQVSTDGWLAVGLAVALLACAALAVAVLALAREVGMLRLRLGPGSALELGHEGPEVGGRSGLIDSFELDRRNRFAVAIFTSVGCHVCRTLAPAIDSLRAEPSLAVRSFEESADAEVWEALAIPGSPYAIALDRDGTVLAKGTFNNLAQLESVVATAERRESDRAAVEALGV